MKNKIQVIKQNLYTKKGIQRLLALFIVLNMTNFLGTSLFAKFGRLIFDILYIIILAKYKKLRKKEKTFH